MTSTPFLPAMLVVCLTSVGGQLLTKDPPTGVPLIPAADSGARFGTAPYTYDAPTKMPDGHVCKSTMQANFYKLYKIKGGRYTRHGGHDD